MKNIISMGNSTKHAFPGHSISLYFSLSRLRVISLFIQKINNAIHVAYYLASLIEIEYFIIYVKIIRYLSDYNK